jgi:hypothetical protein
VTLGELQEYLRAAGRASLVVNQDRARGTWGATARDLNGVGPMTTGHKTLDDACVAIVKLLTASGCVAANRAGGS